jgi:transcriptional regulator with XRE-family HTH domain
VLKKRLGRRIAILRKASKLAQAKLAEKSGYSIEFISLVERGINAPSIDGCERIAKELNVSVRDLFDV